MPCSCAAASADAIEISDGNQLGRGQRPIAQLLAKRAAAHQLRDDVQLAVDFFEVENRGNGGVRERGGGASFSREPLAPHPDRACIPA